MTLRRIAAACLPIVLAVAASLVASADTLPSRVLTFVDDRDGLSLTIQTQVSAPDAGRFTFKVRGLGGYVGHAGAAMRSLSPSSVVVRFAGDATLRPEVATDGTITGSLETPSAAQVELQAQIDPTRHTAEATLSDGNRRYHLVARSSGRGELDRTLGAVEQAFVDDDPLALYAEVNGDVRSAYSAADFASTGRSQSAPIGRVAAMRRLAVTEPQTNELGMISIVATYEVERLTPSGASEVTVFDVFFVQEGASWKLLFSRPR